METDRGSQQAWQARWWLWAPGREAHFRSVSDAIPSSRSLVKPDGELEIANRHHLDYLGATLEELKGRAAADTVHPDDLPAVVDAWREAIAGGEPYNIESRRRRADGVYRWFHTYGFPLRDEQGRVIYCTSWNAISTTASEPKHSWRERSVCSRWWRGGVP